jgi:hypothetical protein
MISSVISAMIAWFGTDAQRIHHFLKVYAFAKAIAQAEKVDERTAQIIDLAALTHDIGIKPSEEKYGSASGRYQQLEGPAPAREMLLKEGIDPAIVERVCWLIAHHHTYTDIQTIDYQILVEADFLVNIHEGEMAMAEIVQIRKNIFRTGKGLQYLDTMYPAAGEGQQ